MNIRCFSYFCIIVVFGILKPVYAIDNADSRALRISVSKFSTVNCDNLYGSIVENMLSKALHSYGTFFMVDAAQKERIAVKEKSLNAEGANNSGILSRKKNSDAGDKMIVGSITENEGLVITVMSIDTQSAEIDIAITEKNGIHDDLVKTVLHISEKIRIFYDVRRELNKKTEFSVRAASFIPVGVYSKYLRPSYGGIATLCVNDIFAENLSLFASSGVNLFSTKQDRYRKFAHLYAVGGPSARFQPVNSIIFSPKAGVGSVWTRMDFDSDGVKNAEGFRYEKKYFQNYCFLLESEISLHLKENWMFSVSNGFMRILDKSNSGSLFYVSAGVKSLL